MGIAGWCSACGQYVWVDAQGACANGHPASGVSNHYDTDTGQPVAAPSQAVPAAESVPQATPAAESVPQQTAPPASGEQHPVGTRLGLLADILATLAQYPGYTARYGTDTDIVVDNEIARASWGIGRKKVEYSAMMKAVEAERVLYLWEMVKEEGAGLSFGGFDSESTTTFGAKRWGVTKEKVIAPGGVVVDYSWDYGKTRSIIESVAARHGFSVKVVLRKKNVTY